MNSRPRQGLRLAAVIRSARSSWFGTGPLLSSTSQQMHSANAKSFLEALEPPSIKRQLIAQASAAHQHVQGPPTENHHLVIVGESFKHPLGHAGHLVGALEVQAVLRVDGMTGRAPASPAAGSPGSARGAAGRIACALPFSKADFMSLHRERFCSKNRSRGRFGAMAA